MNCCDEEIPVFPLRLGATLDFTFDFTDALAPINDHVATYELTIPDTIEKVYDSLNGDMITIWLKATTSRQDCRIECTITTESTPIPRIDPEVMIIKVR